MAVDNSGGDYVQHAREHQRMQEEIIRQQAYVQEDQRQSIPGALSAGAGAAASALQQAAQQLGNIGYNPFAAAPAGTTDVTTTWNEANADGDVYTQTTVTPGQIGEVQDEVTDNLRITGDGSISVDTSTFLRTSNVEITPEMMDEYAEMRVSKQRKHNTFMGWLEAKYA